MGNFGQNPDDPAGHLVVENGNFLKKLAILAHKKICWKNVFFCGLCPWAYQLILFCQNIFVSAHVFLEIFFIKASGQFRFYSLSKELCSLEYWLLEKPPGNSSVETIICSYSFGRYFSWWDMGQVKTFGKGPLLVLLSKPSAFPHSLAVKIKIDSPNFRLSVEFIVC